MTARERPRGSLFGNKRVWSVVVISSSAEKGGIISGRSRSSSANLFAPRFRATKRQGNSCRSFREGHFSSPVWRSSLDFSLKKRANGHELFTVRIRDVQLWRKPSRFPRVGEHGNERKKAVRCDAGGHSAPACRHEFRRLHATHLRGGGQSADRSLIGDRSSRSNGASRLRETRSPAERILLASWLVSASRASEKACTGV